MQDNVMEIKTEILRLTNVCLVAVVLDFWEHYIICTVIFNESFGCSVSHREQKIFFWMYIQININCMYQIHNVHMYQNIK